MVSHSGGFLGTTTLVSFLPSDALGVVMLINAGSEWSIRETVTNRVVDDVLSLAAYNPTGTSFLPDSLITMPMTPTALGKYAGTYSNLGYGSITLCDSLNTQNLSYCAEVLADFTIVDSHPSCQATPCLRDKPRLLAKWSRLWSTHVRLVSISDTGSRH